MSRSGIPSLDALDVEGAIEEAWKRGIFHDLSGDGSWRICTVVKVLGSSSTEAIEELGEWGASVEGVVLLKPLVANATVEEPSEPLFAFSMLPSVRTRIQQGDIVIAIQLRSIRGLAVWAGPIHGFAPTNQIPLDTPGIVLRDGSASVRVGKVDGEEGALDGETIAGLLKEDDPEPREWDLAELAAGRKGEPCQDGRVLIDSDLVGAVLRAQSGGPIDRLILDGNYGEQAEGAINLELTADEIVDVSDEGAIIGIAEEAIRLIVRRANEEEGEGGSLMLAVVDMSKELPKLVSKVAITGNGRATIHAERSVVVGALGAKSTQILLTNKMIALGGSRSYNDQQSPSLSEAAKKLGIKSSLNQAEEIALLTKKLGVLSDQVTIMSEKIELGTSKQKGSYVRGEQLKAYFTTLQAWLEGLAKAPVATVGGGSVVYPVPVPQPSAEMLNPEIKG